MGVYSASFLPRIWNHFFFSPAAGVIKFPGSDSDSVNTAITTAKARARAKHDGEVNQANPRA